MTFYNPGDLMDRKQIDRSSCEVGRRPRLDGLGALTGLPAPGDLDLKNSRFGSSLTHLGGREIILACY